LNLAARLYLWACDRLYNELAWAYDAVSWLVSWGRWSGWRSAALDHLVGSHVLEVGFGTGALLEKLTLSGWDVVGLDPSPSMHRVANRRLRKAGLSPPRILGRVEQMPFPDGTFDDIVATFPAQFIFRRAALREMSRVLAPGGRLMVVGSYLRAGNAPLWQAFASTLSFLGPKGRLQRRRIEEETGLQVTEIQRRDGWAQVQIIIAEKRL
jgi:ubiquinone/menaquinone biosynthesis C-methylase UbiE